MDVTVTSKRCPRCGQTLPVDRFALNAHQWDGLRAYCRDCQREWDREYRSRHPEQDREKHRKYRESHTEERRERRRCWGKNNRQRIREYTASLYASDAEFRTRTLMSGAINKSIGRHGGSKKNQPWEGAVGYTLADLMRHIEGLFAPGMTWENRDKWHIDHIIPQSFFRFTSTDSPAFRECWALSNLRPMWAKDNRVKNDKLPDGTCARHHVD